MQADRDASAKARASMSEKSALKKPAPWSEGQALEDRSYLQRAPASNNTSIPPSPTGAMNRKLPSASASFSRSVSTGALASSSSKDAIQREQSKLVYSRENSNGSITIVSSGENSLPNAISVPVSDSVYRFVKSNPVGLNMEQIENNIPKDQIAKLETTGNYFILLLQNGSNPPLEVKVKKETSGLVQVASEPVVERQVSLEDLRNTLR